MKMTKEPFGVTGDGETVTAFCLTNGAGATARILDYGGVLQSLHVPDRTGAPRDVCLGYKTIAEYEARDCYLGALVGRVANRIADARFALNGKVYELAANNGKNHLHGGRKGFDRRIWRHEITDGALVLSLDSPDGEEQYPGNLHVHVFYRLTADNALTIRYEAETDRDTLVNLTNHTYFNLNGEGNGDVLEHLLTIAADDVTPTDETAIPTGALRPVAGTPFDFRTPRTIGSRIAEDDEQLRFGKGYDHNFALRGAPGTLRPAARAYAAESGIMLDVSTTMPGVQFYTGNYLNDAPGKSGALHAPRTGFCLETQYFPDAVNCAAFLPPILRQGERYAHLTQYRFSVSDLCPSFLQTV